MSKCFLVADPHFGHAGVCRFTSYTGEKIRPWTDPQEMDEALIKNWNSVVSPEDKVYVLGDVSMAKNKMVPLLRCNGRKTLIAGNHDIYNTDMYLQYFDNIRACRVLQYNDGPNGEAKNMIMTHIPIHPDCVERFGINVHGHLHTNQIMISGTKIPNPKYFCVSMEQINFTPISFDDLVIKIKEKQKKYKFGG